MVPARVPLGPLGPLRSPTWLRTRSWGRRRLIQRRFSGANDLDRALQIIEQSQGVDKAARHGRVGSEGWAVKGGSEWWGRFVYIYLMMVSEWFL